MGADDIQRQMPNVFRMKLLGANVVGVESGSHTLKDAMNEAMREWVARVDDSSTSSVPPCGPAPYPEMVRDFQCVIGSEAKAQMQEAIGRQPDVAVACVGGGSNAIGLFHPYIGEENVRLVGVEAGGLGVNTPDHAAPITSGAPIGVLHGFRSYLMQDENGQVLGTHSVSAGLDYPASARNTAICTTSSASDTLLPKTMKHSKPLTCSAASRASSPRSNPATPLLGR